MSHLNNKGPEDHGPKTGRKLGNCKKNEKDLENMGELGKGQGSRKHSGGGKGKGKGKRLKYNIDK